MPSQLHVPATCPIGGHLEGEYPGDPDKCWGADVAVLLYSLLARALNDPQEAVGSLRSAWVGEVGSGGYRRGLWVLTAVFVETLLQVGDLAAAAEVSRSAPRLLA